MANLVIEDSGIVYTNPAPGLEPVHAMQPAVRAVSDSELVCIYRHGTAMESVYSVLGRCRSLDGGKTWRHEGFVERTLPGDEPIYSYFCPHLTLLADGRLVLLSGRFRRDDPRQRVYNPDTGGCLHPDTTFFTSADAGRTWEGPSLIPVGGRYAYSGGPVVELADGRWMVVFESWKAFADPAPLATRLFALFSSDGGRSWGNESLVYDDPQGLTRLWDVGFLRLSGQTVVGLAWTHDTSTDNDLPHHRLVSHNSGATWDPPVGTSRSGQYNATTRLPDGRLFGVYNVRHGASPGVYATTSEDEGLSWRSEDQVQLWDARGRSRIGEDVGATCLEELASFAFGKPDIACFGDGRVLVAFWATRACVTHVRFSTLRV